MLGARTLEMLEDTGEVKEGCEDRPEGPGRDSREE